VKWKLPEEKQLHKNEEWILFTGWANHKKKKKHFKAGASVSEASVSFS
jgi:hypothetical protein